MNPPIYDPVTNGHNAWPPAVLNFAVMELIREFPQLQVERVVSAVNSAAQVTPVQAGRVALMQKARELLR